MLCTTGFSETQLAEIESAATAIPIFRSANMSLGVSVLQALVKKAAAVLEGYDIEIVERHHNRKVDAPSGTALMLADAAASARLQPSEYIYDRHSVRQPRGRDEIGNLLGAGRNHRGRARGHLCGAGRSHRTAPFRPIP